MILLIKTEFYHPQYLVCSLSVMKIHSSFIQYVKDNIVLGIMFISFLVSMLRVPVGDGVDGELVVRPARVLDAVARPARLVPHLHLRVQRQVLRTKYFYEK